jgi:uncharacterized protein YjbJ (UPF0337 family)
VGSLVVGIDRSGAKRRLAMAGIDKVKNKAQEVKGKMKESAGRANNDKSLRVKGKKDQAAGNLKQAGEKVKDAVKR